MSDEAPQRYGITFPFDGIPLLGQRELVRELVDLGYTDLWSAESGGYDAFIPLAVAAQWAPELRLGTAIVPVYTRGAHTLASTVASMCQAAPGRFALGLGTSSNVIVERWNGMTFDKPYQRVRDTIRFLRAALAGEKVTETYETFAVNGFRLGITVPEQPPILVAALRQGMLRLAGTRRRRRDRQLALRRRREDRRAARRAGKEIAARIFVLPSDDPGLVYAVGKRAIASYLTVPVYAAFHEWLGRGDQLADLWRLWKEGDRKAAADVDPERGRRPAARVGQARAVPRAHPALHRQRRDHPRARAVLRSRRAPGRGTRAAPLARGCAHVSTYLSELFTGARKAMVVGRVPARYNYMHTRGSTKRGLVRMRKVSGLLVAFALLLPVGVTAAAPAGSAVNTVIPKCKLFAGTQTYTPGLPPVTSKTLVKPVGATNGTFTNCTGGGITKGTISASAKSTVATNCTTLFKDIAAKKPQKPTVSTLKWSNGQTSTSSSVLTVTGSTKTALIGNIVAKTTAGLGKGHTSTIGDRSRTPNRRAGARISLPLVEASPSRARRLRLQVQSVARVDVSSLTAGMGPHFRVGPRLRVARAALG